MAKSSKGGQFERDICKALSLWWSIDERDDLFWRTSQSGGRATTRRKKGIMNTAGGAADLMATSESGRPLTKVCLFEMKRGYSQKHKIVKSKKTGKFGIRKTRQGMDILSFLDKLKSTKDPILLEWWRKLEKERIATKRNFSFIIFRRDAKESCIVMSHKTFKFLLKRNGDFFSMIIAILQPPEETSLVILKLDHFLTWCQPACFLNVPRVIPRRSKKQMKKPRRQIKRRS